MSATSKGTLDGGPFKCGLHKVEFVTTDPTKWQEHILNDETVQHTFSGTKLCGSCGKSITFTNEPVALNVFCDKCKTKLFKDMKELGKGNNKK